jgi:NAD(P)-dependent dehydrogenase (short-subunit alcohol dehydrogenase family)
MATDLPWKTVWITGASTGIGREIAIQLAQQGVTVAASARSADKLASLGHGIHPFPLDVTDKDAVMAAAAEIETQLGPIDLALFGAGTYAPADIGNLDPAQFATTMSVNYMGVINGLAAVLPRMRKRRAGHIAWIASVAGYRGLPKAAAYGPTKAALINLAESLKPELELLDIKTSVINPGFVETPLTEQNDFKMPFLMQPEEAARLTIEGLKRGRFEIAYPWQFVTMLKIGRLLPYNLYFRMIRRQVLKS